MGDLTDRHHAPRIGLTRRQVVQSGGTLALGVALGSRVQGAFAQATPVTSPEIEAYYTPASGAYQGTKLTVVMNSGFFSTESSKLAIEGLRDQFQQLTGAEVEIVPLPENQMYDQVRLELSTSSGKFDLMHTGAGGAKDYGLSGFLVPLPVPPDVDDFFPADVAQYTAGDNLYGLPMTADINIFYWRTDLFEQAGLDPNTPPATYDQFREYAKLLTTDGAGKHPGDEGFDENDIQVFGSAFKGVAGLGCSWEWYNYLYAFGGDLLDADFNPTLNSPEAVAALTWVVDNFRTEKIYPPDIVTYDYTEFHTLFIQGKVAMAVNWPYMWGLAQDPAQSMVVGKVAVGIKPKQATYGGEIGGWSWNVFQMSKNQDAAIAFAKWMISPTATLAYGNAATGNSVRKSVAAAMAEKDPVVQAAISVNQESGRSVRWLDTGPSWLEIEKVVYEAIQRGLIGDGEPQGILDEANEQVKEILEKNKFYEELLPQLKSGA